MDVIAPLMTRDPKGSCNAPNGAKWSAMLRGEGGVIRLVVVDDHPSYAHGLKTLFGALTADLDVEGVACEPQEGVNLVKDLAPDIVILDVRMPGQGGLGAAREIRQTAPNVKIVMLTYSPELQDARECLEAGVSGYLTKAMENEALIASLRAVYEGAIVIVPIALQALLREPLPSDPVLTPADREILELVAEGLDHAQIVRRLSMSDSTLKRRLSLIAKRLGARNRVEAAILAAKKGLI